MIQQHIALKERVFVMLYLCNATHLKQGYSVKNKDIQLAFNVPVT